MMKKDVIIDDEKDPWWEVLRQQIWWPISDFFKSWIYPGHYTRNMLFYRYDRVKLPQVKPWEYAEPCDRIKYAVFEQVCDFVDDEVNDPIVEWYGEHGAKLDGRYVMDIGREIRQWWRVDRQIEEKKYWDFLDFYCTWVIGKLHFHKPDKNGLGLVTFDEDHLPKTYDDYMKVVSDEDWKKYDACCDDRTKIVDHEFSSKLSNSLEQKMDDTDDHFLHEAIRIRQYLWT